MASSDQTSGAGDQQTAQVAKRPIAPVDDDDDEEDLDETLAERLWGLTEMFPESVRNFCGSLASKTVSFSKTSFQFGRSAVWIAASSATILALPVIFESERAQQQEQQIQQQRQILLGPNAAVTGGGGQLLPGMVPPGMMPGVTK